MQGCFALFKKNPFCIEQNDISALIEGNSALKHQTVKTKEEINSRIAVTCRCKFQFRTDHDWSRHAGNPRPTLGKRRQPA